MKTLLCCLLLLCSPPPAAPLFCYTCVFPTLWPEDCIRVPLRCPPGHMCLCSQAEGRRGGSRVVLLDKSCVAPPMCGLTGHKHLQGLNFTFTNRCCDTHLCNAAPLWRPLLAPMPPSAAPCWTVTALLSLTAAGALC